MKELLNREQLDKHMEAWRMYYVDKRPTTAIAAHFGVSRQSIRNWIVSLGGDLDDDNMQRVLRDRVRGNLAAGQMLCRECDVITPAHDSGLCAACRGDEDASDERRAWLEFEAGWLRRNLCVKRA